MKWLLWRAIRRGTLSDQKDPAFCNTKQEREFFVVSHPSE